MKKFFENVITLTLMISMLTGLTGCANERSEVTKETKGIVITATAKATNEALIKSEEKQKSAETAAPTLTPKLEDKTAKIVTFGDALCHSPVYNSLYDSKKGDYDFTPLFQYVKKHFKNSTINIGNLESPLAGKKRGYSGYPRFNAPEHLAIDLKKLGVDIMTTSNNHTLDKGYDGLISTLKYLDKAGIEHTGTARSKKEQNKILFKDLNGIKTAFLSYTYGTNGISVPIGKEYAVNYINKKLIKKHIKKAKKQGAECIIVSIHWGIEYKTKQNAQQEELAKFLVKNGVNVILGCHPHVLQEMRMVKVGKKKGLVIYSQGNFFSNQSNQTMPNTQNTALFKIKIRKNAVTGKITIEKATYIPIFVYRNGIGKNRYKLLDLNAIIKDYKGKNKNHWSSAIYQLAVREREKCINIIGPTIK